MSKGNIQFENFALDCDRYELLRGNRSIKLEKLPMELLILLVERRGHLVTRQEIAERIWGSDVFVDTEHGINTAVRKLRTVLGDNPEQSRFIQTVTGKGYRFVATTTDIPSSADNGGNGHGPRQIAPSPPSLLAAHEGNEHQKEILKHGGRRRMLWVLAAACALVTVMPYFRLWNRSPADPRVAAIIQLTDDGEAKCCRLATDGSRIYFNEGSIGSFKLAQVAATGGPTGMIATAVGDPTVRAIDPAGSTLLVSSVSNKDTNSSVRLWSIPLPVGEPHLFNNIEADEGQFFPDGRVLFAQGPDIYASDKDGSNARKLFTVSGHPAELQVAPDGKEIAFNLFTENDVSLVVTKLNGAMVRRIPASCCGRWTPDGKYIVVSNIDVARKDLWAVPAKAGFLRRAEERFRLTNGPLSYGGSGVTMSRDGKQIFAIGKSLRSELVRYDLRLKRFVPFLAGTSVSSPAFSKDGLWLAYLSYPDRTLWRSRIDGTERLQLSTGNFPGDSFFLSPDGKKVLFSRDGGIFTISMEGGAPQKIIGDNVEAASWSPDGKALLLTSKMSGTAYLEKGSACLQTLDLQSGKLSTIPGSAEIGFQGDAAWWQTPDLLVASVPGKLVTFDFKTQEWSDLLSGDFVSCAPSVDSTYMYCASGGPEPKALRIRMANRTVETITGLKDIRRTMFSAQIRIAPDGSPVFTRDVGSQQIYALTVAWP